MIVWGQDAHTNLNKILRVLHLIILYFAPYKSHAIPLRNTSYILPLNLHYFKTISLLIHDDFNSLIHIHISNLLYLLALQKFTRFSAASNFYIKSLRTDHLKNSFFCLGAKIWNSIPKSIRLLPKNYQRLFIIQRKWRHSQRS